MNIFSEIEIEIFKRILFKINDKSRYRSYDIFDLEKDITVNISDNLASWGGLKGNFHPKEFMPW